MQPPDVAGRQPVVPEVSAIDADESHELDQVAGIILPGVDRRRPRQPGVACLRETAMKRLCRQLPGGCEGGNDRRA